MEAIGLDIGVSHILGHSGLISNYLSALPFFYLSYSYVTHQAFSSPPQILKHTLTSRRHRKRLELQVLQPFTMQLRLFNVVTSSSTPLPRLIRISG